MSRPRVFLLHAFPLDCRMWAETKEALERAGYQVTAPDFPGPEAEGSLGAWADRVLRQTDGSFVPVGSSMGGYLAFELWRRAPGLVAALGLVGTRAGADTPEGRAGRDEMIELLRDVGPPALWERLEGRLFSPDAPGAVISHAREIALEQGTERLVGALEAIRDRTDSTSDLAEIEVPTLVLHGTEDALIPFAEAEATAAAVPGARLMRVEGAGHLVPLERPGEVSRALLSFLETAT